VEDNLESKNLIVTILFKKLQVNVVAQSKMVRSNRASRLLRIKVLDVDDNQPVFAPYASVGLIFEWIWRCKKM
jgi:hypothetical protein